MRVKGSPAEMFWAKVKKSDGCWEWTGATVRDGYGAFRLKRRTLRANRVAWEFENGPIPPGLFVLHRCDNPSCVRPEHLFLGTSQDNVRDMWAKGRATGPQFKQRSHCSHGHPFTAENTSIDPRSGARGCRACGRANQARYRLARATEMAA